MDGQPTILVADRDSDVLDRAARALFRTEDPYDLVAARDGVEAYRAIQVLRPSLVLIAPDLPVVDGATIIAAFARAPAHRQRPFVGLVDEGADAVAQQMIQSGAREVLWKPFTPERLRERVAAILETEEPSDEAPVLIVCSDVDYRIGLAACFSEQGVRSVAASIGEFALARATAERVRAVLLVEPVIGLEPAGFLIRLRERCVTAPVLLLGPRPPACPGIRYLGRRRSPSEPAAFVRKLLEEAAAPR